MIQTLKLLEANVDPAMLFQQIFLCVSKDLSLEKVTSKAQQVPPAFLIEINLL